MKIGDLLICNDGKTEVKIANFDQRSISILYKNKIHIRPRSAIGKTLHYLFICKECQDKISPLFCQKCTACGWYICNNCHSGHKYDCIHYSGKHNYHSCDTNYSQHSNSSDFSYDVNTYNDEEDNSYDYGWGGDDGPDDNYNYYYNDDYDGEDYGDY